MGYNGKPFISSAVKLPRLNQISNRRKIGECGMSSVNKEKQLNNLKNSPGFRLEHNV